ncbi:hypothetical protein, partial [Staphylococcus pasteuri_A]
DETDWNNNQLIPQFSENAPLAEKKNGRRKDMAGIVASAEVIASTAPTVLGKRVRELIAYAEESGDLEVFQSKLIDMLSEGPS